MQLHAPGEHLPERASTEKHCASVTLLSFVRYLRYPSLVCPCFFLDSPNDGLGSNLKCCVIDLAGRIPLRWQVKVCMIEDDTLA